ncbi:MAG: hypothetical protein ACKKMR_00745 [Candidatus Nealsonbacteria bacterium]
MELTNKVDFGAKKILVKFFFTNRKLIPKGISLKERHENQIETKHLKQGGVEAMERYRRGRVDTAKKHQQIENVDIRNFWKKISEKFGTTNTHIFYQKRSNGMKKPVVVITFEKNPENSRRAKKPVIEQIVKNFVKHGTWGIVHYWQNPNGTDTVNCLKRQPSPSKN